jgi:hypothetical protein
MSATRHGIIRIETARGEWASDVTARARCACGKWRQAGSFSRYPGEAGAILLASRRVDCEPGTLDASRVRSPFPADAGSMERAADALDRKSAQLRADAESLIRQAEEYEAGSTRIRSDLAGLDS